MDLYEKLRDLFDTGPIPFPSTETRVELDLIKELFSEEDCKIMLALGWVRVSAEKIYKRIKKMGILERIISLEELKDKLHTLYMNGSINMKIKKGIPKYCLDPIVVGWYEHKIDLLTPKQVKMFYNYADDGPFPEIWGGDGVNNATKSQMRVIIHPNAKNNIKIKEKNYESQTIEINESITHEPTIAHYDDVRAILSAMPEDTLFVNVNCICKKSQDLIDEPCKVTDNRRHCLSIGEGAQKYLDRDQGIRITKQEAKDLLEWQIKQGLVLQCGNYRDELREVCACCGCCCGVLMNAKKLKRPVDVFNIRYQAAISDELCKNCGKCASKCQMDAIEIFKTNGKKHYTINLDRCIGCGVCVEACKFDAISLIKYNINEPPKTKDSLIAQRIKDRFGTLGYIKFVLKALIGMKV
jgi:Na+-translocating ferredoxin:NAD+ oxidoreductase subunit B